jgi:hypothetical protein
MRTLVRQLRLCKVLCTLVATHASSHKTCSNKYEVTRAAGLLDRFCVRNLIHIRADLRR